MATVENPRFCFEAEWLDPSSGVTWRYQLFYYPKTNEVEMVDIKNHKTFLKRTFYEHMRPELLFVGSTVTVYSRQLKLLKYGDEYTRKHIEMLTERTLAMIKPDAYKHMGKIITAIDKAGFRINNMRACYMTKPQAEAFYEVHRGKPFFEKLTTFMSSGRMVAIELVAEGAIARWRQLIGPTNSDKAREEAPSSIRARFGTDGSYNAVHGSDAPDTAAAEIDFFFGRGSRVGVPMVGRDTTLCVIKPHVVSDGLAGYMLDLIAEKFEVTALRLAKVGPNGAAEFYDLYKGVLAAGELEAMIAELVSGNSIAAELALPGSAEGQSAVQPFRELCGPADPELAAALRPNSLRAQFGVSKIRNAVHCTDLPEDGTLEVEYFFSTLPNLP